VRCAVLAGAAAALFLSAGLAPAQIRWSVTTRQEGAARLVSATARNTGSAPAPPGRHKLSEEVVPLSPDAVALVMTGWQDPSRVQRIRGGKPLVSKILTQLWDGRAAFHAGFITFDRVSTEHEIRWDEARRAAVVSSYCDFESYMLAPGAEVAAETLLLDTGTDPYTALETWAGRAAAHYRPPLWPKIPAGWVGWSWVDGFNIERYEDVVRRNARAIRERLPGLDIEYIWVSIGNLDERRPGNWLRWNLKLFPSGHEAFIRDLGGLGFKLGLWAGAYWLNDGLKEDYARLRDAVLTRGGAPLTVPSKQWGDSYILDPTHPKVKEHIRRVFQVWRQWGVRYYMIDFLNAIGGSIPGTFLPDSLHDRSLIPGPQSFREGLKTIREAAGPDTYLLASTGPTFWTTGLVNAVRAGTDYGEGRPLDGPGMGFFPGTFVINRPDYWTSHRRATEAWATHFFAHNRLFLADSGNVLTIDKPIPLSDAEITATIFGLNGGPVMLGDDIDRMDPGRLEMLKQVFPRLPECARPIDLFDSPAPDYPKAFRLHLRRDWDEWDLVAVFNYGNDPLPYKLDADPATHLVWDFWNQQASSRTLVAPRSVKLWRIARRRPHPWIASTDMHLRQGQAEIESCRWDAASRVLTIRAQRPAGHRGNVFVTVPKDMAVANPAGLWIAKDANDNTLLIRVPFDFKDGRPVERQVRF
jgi:hypothetical protein